MDLVLIKNNEVMADSRVIAEKFDRTHKYVTDRIEKLIKKIENNEQKQGVKKLRPKIIEMQKQYRGQDWTYYLLNRLGYELLVMGFTGDKAFNFKMDYLQAFHAMEEYIKNQQNVEWIEGRKEGKLIRKNMTDAVKLLVDHAKSQGSKNADKYYMSLTKMEYRALDFIYKTDNNLRDQLRSLDLSMIKMSEAIIEGIIIDCVSKEMFYKDIYQECKKAVLKYTDSISMLRDDSLIETSDQIRQITNVKRSR